ncbi:hypothetical protein H2198_007429 [Neophaeococcomyces mojaviensis]|uniref:Uncharacterized protein n=1 Tax=Neophaeococcomyces mojaviensis TaxID=3383035 RepID=A0ACC3A088_9EURO|nr:hypothetical protein H2198_007429 [Knufia sp. JES_112]
MADTTESHRAPPRPWTPTERPGDASYAIPVVYHGDHHIDSDSEASEDEKEASNPPLSPSGIEVDIGDRAKEKPQSQLLSSEAVEKSISSSPELQSYLPYRNTTSPPEAESKPEIKVDNQPEGRPTSKHGRAESKDDLPSVVGRSSKQIKILLINPNSTKSMTDRCLQSLTETLPAGVTVYGFTASRPSPTAIESITDAIMSTAACTKAILPIASNYDAFLVACFSHHPLIDALREQLMQPVVGILEASLYASRMCGSKFGILTPGIRSMHLVDASVKNEYGLGQFSVGSESVRVGALELESLPEEVLGERLSMAAMKLQVRGAECIALGCAGMTDLKEACQEAVGMHDRVAMVIDGVPMGIHFLIGLVREGLGTAKGGAYNINSGHKALRKPES